MINGVTGLNGIDRLAGPSSRAEGVGSGTARTEAASGKPGPLATATAELSPIVRDMAAGPPIDADKVQTLKDAIARGDYRPDPMHIAAKMLALAPGASAA